jgi:hypothetical protein
MNPQFSLTNVNENLNQSNYLNARYAPTGNESYGLPFLSFKEVGARFTQNYPVALSMSTLKKQMNLPTDTNTFRDAVIGDAVSLQNIGNKNWVYATQTLTNPSVDTQFCTTDLDCKPLGPKFTCNSNFENWQDSFGNQSGSVCVYTAYPEVENSTGTYQRKNEKEGGIGKMCRSDNDCGQGYSCNLENNMFGSSIQQTGYCAQKYSCPDGSSKFLGYPYNSSVPIAPPSYQNNNGSGYATEKECNANMNGAQKCVNYNGTWMALYPGYCPIAASRRQGGPQGALPSTSMNQYQQGFSIPAYATSKGSNLGNAKGLASLNLAAPVKQKMSPTQYELSINPRPANF